MARTSKENKLAQIHDEAMREFSNIWTAQKDERSQCIEDRRFYSISGAQWEGTLGEQFENKPKFEVNKVHLAVIRIFNEYRNNRISVEFIPKSGEENDQLADTCAGLYRADEADSSAEEAYDNAFEEAVGGGFGAWRLRTEYEDESDEDDDRQRIRIEPIFDADSTVFFDLNAKRQDKADAKSCFVLTPMTPEAYKSEYGHDPSTWPKPDDEYSFDWYKPNVVYVAEYYRVEEVSEIVRVYRDLAGEAKKYYESDFESEPELEATLAATGSVEIRQKKVKTRKIHKYIFSGVPLEDAGYIAGRCIPIVPVYGKRWYVDNVERYMGHVRLSKDITRLGNMLRSKLAEISALSSVEKPIFIPEQMAGHQAMWEDNNVKDYPYLLINPITDVNGTPLPAGPIDYTRSPQIPQVMAALMQISDQDMRDILGNQQGGDEVVSNISGKAVEMIQQRLDMQTFIYMSNMSKAVKRSGEIWLSMGKDVFVEQGRKLKSVGDQGQLESVELLRPVVNDGETTYENDFKDAKFDLVVDVGPSSSSKRQSTVRSIMGMMQITTDPETIGVLSGMAMLNMEGEGISDVRDYFRDKLIRQGVVKPTKEEAARLAEEQQQEVEPSPEAKYLNAQAIKSLADAEKTGAETQKIINEMSPDFIASGISGDGVKLEAEVKKEALKLQTTQEVEETKRQSALLNLEAEKVKADALIKAAQETGSANIEELKQSVESLNTQIQEIRKQEPHQPVVIQTGGGKTFNITKTPSGYTGEVVDS